MLHQYSARMKIIIELFCQFFHRLQCLSQEKRIPFCRLITIGVIGFFFSYLFVIFKTREEKLSYIFVVLIRRQQTLSKSSTAQQVFFANNDETSSNCSRLFHLHIQR